jgi:hypothetical protein
VKQSQLIVPDKAQTKATLQPTSSLKNIADEIKIFLSNTRCQITYEMLKFFINLLGS